ncbi:hypothetical protein ACO0LB_20245 [Undibacterium sp. SXout7W]|uniref:hypothetical protein n=1 Tax=Undibacterium sp. SXout7W TaxID=3413049 RepID=UPI003BEFF520
MTYSSNRKINSIALLLGVFAALCSPSYAQQPNFNSQQHDPVRWHQEDFNPEAYFSTLRKEAYAVYQESLQECRHGYMRSRNPCIREAKAQLQSDLIEAENTSHTRRRLKN